MAFTLVLLSIDFKEEEEEKNEEEEEEEEVRRRRYIPFLGITPNYIIILVQSSFLAEHNHNEFCHATKQMWLQSHVAISLDSKKFQEKI